MNSLLLPEYQNFILTPLGNLCLIAFCIVLIIVGSVSIANIEYYLKEKEIIKKNIHYRHSKADYISAWAVILSVLSLISSVACVSYLSDNQAKNLGKELSSNKIVVSYEKLADSSLGSSDLENYFDRATECINKSCRFSPENSIVLSEYLLMPKFEKLRYSNLQIEKINSNITRIEAELSKLALKSTDSEKELKSSAEYTSRTFRDNSFFESQLLSAIGSFNPRNFTSTEAANEKLSMLLKVISMKETPLTLGFKHDATNLIKSRLVDLKSLNHIQG